MLDFVARITFFTIFVLVNQMFNLSNLIVMKSFEIISILTKGLIPVERCGTAVFETSDLSELSMLFGKNYSWAGHMFSGDVFFVYHYPSDDWTIEDADLVGFNLKDAKEVISVFKVGA